MKSRHVRQLEDELRNKEKEWNATLAGTRQNGPYAHSRAVEKKLAEIEAARRALGTAIEEERGKKRHRALDYDEEEGQEEEDSSEDGEEDDEDEEGEEEEEEAKRERTEREKRQREEQQSSEQLKAKQPKQQAAKKTAAPRPARAVKATDKEPPAAAAAAAMGATCRGCREARKRCDHQRPCGRCSAAGKKCEEAPRK